MVKGYQYMYAAYIDAGIKILVPPENRKPTSRDTHIMLFKVPIIPHTKPIMLPLYSEFLYVFLPETCTS